MSELPSPLFNFQLLHPDVIEPWTAYRQGRPSHLSIHWYALSLGYYWIDLGVERIYEGFPDAESGRELS